MAVCGVVAFFMSDLPYFSDATLYPDTHLSSPYLPVILSMLAGYIVAESFFNVRRHRCPPHSPAQECAGGTDGKHDQPMHALAVISGMRRARCTFGKWHLYGRHL